MNIETDKAVSDSYRAAAAEKTPEHLDAAVLAEARRAVRPKYARSRAWTRPLAWAATIALSVAIVLELTQSPLPDGIGSAGAPVAPQAASESLDQDAPARGRLASSVPEAPQPAPIEEKLELQKISANDFVLRDKELVDRAERADEVNLPEERSAEVFAAKTPTQPACPEEATDDPEQWLACIEALEADGRTRDAAEQKRLLLESFPDFDLP